MVSCLDNRRTSVLAYGRWLARPWDDTSHCVHPRVHDKGFALAALLQEFDNADLGGTDTNISKLSHCLQRGVDMDADLEKWYEEFLIRSPSPSYWPTSTSNYTRFQQQIADSSPRGFPLLSYPNLIVATATITLWALKLIFSDEVATIYHIILSTNRKACADSPATDPAASLALVLMAQRAENQHSIEYRMILATDITRSMPYCLNHTMGLLGPEKAFFALRTALATLRRHPGPELEWCRAAHQRLDNASDLRGMMQLHRLLYGSCGLYGVPNSPSSRTNGATPSTTESEVESREEPIGVCLLAISLRGNILLNSVVTANLWWGYATWRAIPDCSASEQCLGG